MVRHIRQRPLDHCQGDSRPLGDTDDHYAAENRTVIATLISARPPPFDQPLPLIKMHG